MYVGMYACMYILCIFINTFEHAIPLSLQMTVLQTPSDENFQTKTNVQMQLSRTTIFASLGKKTLNRNNVMLFHTVGVLNADSVNIMLLSDLLFQKEIPLSQQMTFRSS